MRSILLTALALSVTVTTAASEEPSSPTVVSRDVTQEPEAAPAPAWGRETYGASVG